MEEQKPKVEEKSKEVSIVERAEAAAKRLEEANKKQEELMIAQEQIKARDMLGGRAFAGHVEPQIDPEVKKKMDLKNYFKGSAIENYIK